MDVTIQVDEAQFNRFKATCKPLGIAAGDYIEGVVARAIGDVLDGIAKVFETHLPDFLSK